MKVKTLSKKDTYWTPKKKIDWEAPSKSKLQKSCKDLLALVWQGDSVAEEQRIPSTKLSVDFVNFTKKIMVEVDGEQHRKYNKYFHNGNIFNFAASIKRDDKKEKFAELNGFQLIRVRSAKELNEVLFEINNESTEQN